MTHIVIVDFGTGNLRSVSKAIEHVAPHAQVEVSAQPHVIRQADRIVLPGQGAIATWMQALEDPALAQAVRGALDNKPVLGICLGLEALYEHSSEGDGTDCLGVLTGRVRHFSDVITDRRLKIPHMGWNRVYQSAQHPLWNGIEDGERFYFVHSYFVDGADSAHVAGQTDYGVRFTCAAARANLFATQFHPEKSAAPGLRLLENFARWQI